MDTIVQRVNPEYFQDKELEKACQILQSGGLVAFPTETVYGLGGNALLEEASHKIYTAKGRPSDNPLIVHIADMDGLYDVADKISEKALALAEAFWPGPLTMIFEKGKGAIVNNRWFIYGSSPYAESSGCSRINPAVGRVYCSTKCKYIRPSKPYESRTCNRGFAGENRYDSGWRSCWDRH